MARVSVVLTSFNHENYIRQAIDSVLNQTFTDFELIIWDDASADDSWAIINSYSDFRIKAFHNAENKRPIFGVIKAISQVASGEYIAMHHSDDIWEPDKLEKQVAFLDAHREIGAVFTDALAIGEDGSRLVDEQHAYSSVFNQPNRSRHEWLRHFFSSGNALCHPSVLIRKVCYRDCGLYRYGLAQSGDFDMWIRLCMKYEIHVMPEKLVRFRVRNSEANTSGDRPDARIRWKYEFYKALRNYREIAGIGELVKIFPFAEKYDRGAETDMGYALARVALEEHPYFIKELFGQELLFEAINDPQRAANIRRLYDFDYKSFIALTGQHDVFSRETVADQEAHVNRALDEIARQHKEADRLNQEIDRLNQETGRLNQEAARLNQSLAEREQQLHLMLNSRSWKITAPLRKLTVVGGNISARLQRVTGLFARLARLLKVIPITLQTLGWRGVVKRGAKVVRKRGIRGLLRSGEAIVGLHEDAIGRQSGFHSLPPPPKDFKTPRIVYVINRHDLMTQAYRVHNYSTALTAAGYVCETIREQDIGPDTVIDADLLVFNRIPWNEHIDALVDRFRTAARQVIFDIDDFVFDPDQIALLRQSARMSDAERDALRSRMEGFQKTMKMCDLVTVSTFALKTEVEKYGLPAYVLPNNNGSEQIAYANSLMKQGSGKAQSGGPVRIGYFSGTQTHEQDFAQCADALVRVLNDNPETELLVVGQLELPAVLAGMADRVRRLPLMSHQDMLRELAAIDINLAPLESGNLFTDCKSELKIFEPALFGIPTVATPTSTFAALVENGKSGFLAATPDEWYAALSALVKNGELRRQVGAAARDRIAPRYAITATVEEARTIYNAAFSGKLRRKPEHAFDSIRDTGRPLITIVSVLYRKAKEVRYFLEALRRQDFPGHYEIILVDDRTPDDSVAVVQAFRKWAAHKPDVDARMDIRILQNPANIGNCGSRNAAIREAHGDIIIVVDADCMFNRSFLSAHFAAHMKGDCDVAIGPINIETHDAPPLSVLERHEATTALAEAENLPQDPINLDSFVNCITRNFSVQRSFIEKNLGGTLFDEDFAYSADPKSGFGWEDVEMGYRVYDAGGRIKYLADTVSIHVSHESSANEAEKPIRSLRNFRRLFQKHPGMLTASRPWSIHTYDAIVGWAGSVGADLQDNPDQQWLEPKFRRYRQAPIIIDRSRRLRVLTYRWHVPHQFELYKSGHDFTLLKGTGTGLCDSWEVFQRPIPNNAWMVPFDQVDTRDFDVAILHFDENALRPELCNGRVPKDWGRTLRWFIDNVDLPKAAICHGTPQFAGQYDAEYKGADLGQVYEAERKAMVNLLRDITVVCNSYQSQSEWGFHKSRTIWHGFSPHEYPPGSHERGILAMGMDRMQDRPHYNGLFVFEAVRNHLGGDLDLECLKAPHPLSGYTVFSPEWAVAKYQNYVREVGRYSVYFNPTVRSPMPRARGEAMMAGLVPVSLRNHDVDLFIKNGVNGFYADTPEELAEQLIWLAERPSAREKISRAARATAMDVFNQDRYLSNWSQLLNELSSR